MSLYDAIRTADAVLQVSRLGPEATREQVLEAINAIDHLKAQVRAATAEAEQAIVAWLTEHGDLACGEMRYYAGTASSTRCMGPARTAQAILAACSGDLDQLFRCLASDPFKIAATREALGHDFVQYFETTTKPDLKTGRPLRRLHKQNLAFVPPAAAGGGPDRGPGDVDA